MNTYNRGDAGRRAAAEIRRNAAELGISLREEMRHLGLNTNALLWTWEHGGHDLTSAALYALWLGGYDIVYIVTGVREAPSQTSDNAVVVWCAADKYPHNDVMPDDWYCAAGERKEAGHE